MFNKVNFFIRVYKKHVKLYGITKQTEKLKDKNIITRET